MIFIPFSAVILVLASINLHLCTPNEPAKEADGEKSSRLGRIKRFYPNIQNPLPISTSFLKLGDKLCEQGKYEEAIKVYTKAIKRHPKNMDYYRKRGMCSQIVKDWDSAISDFRQIVRAEPHRLHIWYLLIQVLFEARKHDDVGKELIFLTNNELVIQLAQKLEAANKFEEALSCYSEAIKRAPLEARFHRLRGNLHMKLERFDMAISDFKNAVDSKKDPSNEYDRVHLSEALYSAGKIEEAIQVTSVLDDFQLVKLGTKLLSDEKFEDAFHCFTRAIEKNPANLLAYENRGLCQWKLGNLNEAIADFEKVIEQIPPTASLVLNLVELLLQTRRYADAKITLDQLNVQRLEADEKARWQNAFQKLADTTEIDEIFVEPPNSPSPSLVLAN